VSAVSSSAVLRDLVEQLKQRVPASAFTLTFERSSGPGGQNVNKVNTRATLTFDVAGASGLTPAEQQLVRSKLAGRVSREGALRVTSSRFRTQAANRRAVVERCYELLASALRSSKPRKATKPTAAARRRRLQTKRDQSLKKSLRRARMDDV
jgi:ribosome-associated protein